MNSLPVSMDTFNPNVLNSRTNNPSLNSHAEIEYHMLINSPQKGREKDEESDYKLIGIRKKKYKCISRSEKSNMSYYVFGEKDPQKRIMDNEDDDFNENSISTLFVNCPPNKINNQSIENIFTPRFDSLLRREDLFHIHQSNDNIDILLPKLESDGFSRLKIKCATDADIDDLGNKATIDEAIACDGDTIEEAYRVIPSNLVNGDTTPVSDIINQKLSSSPLSPSDASTKIPKLDWNNYYRLNVIHSFMEDLEREFPSLCSTDTIGKSIEGRDLKILKISNSEATNSAVWIDAGIHAREWITPAVNTYIANYIARNFESLPECMTNKDWYFLPVVNPDGYEYSHTKNRMWRKNRAWYAGECVGVDLNRNFSFNWGGRGSSSKPTHNFYRGPEPFSEPESNAIREFMTNSGIDFKVYLTLHSFGQIIIFPFASSVFLCPDYIRLLQGATIMSKAIYDTNGNTYKVGVSRDVMYLASGTSNDWCYGSVGIPYCYLIELRSKKHKFKVPNDEINATGNEILNCVIALMDFVDKTGSLNIWKEESSTMDIMVEGKRAAQVAGMLHEREIPYSVAIGDLGIMMDKEQCIASSLRRSYNLYQMDWNNYHRLDTIYAFMHNLATEYPYICTVIVIGRSVEGRDLLVLKISNGNVKNPGVWLDGAIHPREWISTAVVTYIADTIVRTFNDQPECVTNKDWYILPVLNPDGYEYTHTHDRMWRKNRAQFGECVGVDLNRNFSYGWGENGEEGSSEDPGNIFHRGPNPFSEPETIAIRHMILDSTTNFKVFLSFHSYGEVIIFPWGYTADPCPDYVELLEGGTAMARAIHETSGHTYKVGSTKDLMYYAAGTSIDWSYGVAGIPYSYMIELRSKKHRFLLPKEEILSTSQEIMNGLSSLMDFVDKRSKGTQSFST